jgi:opacity protein-like surface antigen
MRMSFSMRLTGCLIFTSIILFVTNSYAEKNSTLLSEPKLTNSAEKNSTLPFETEFIFSTGYRRDELDWNIAGDNSGNNPNILSELTWDDLEILQIKFQNKTVIPNIFYFRASVSYGWIYDGENQDSDYLGDNRTLEYSRSNNNADDGDVWDASVGIGYPLRLGVNEIWTITPLVGYSYHEQNLKMTDGNQTIATPPFTPPLGPFSGLDSTYETEWKGPWIGLDLYIKAKKVESLPQRIEPYVSIEYHWADYSAEADWNLRPDFEHPKSFEHKADGDGWVLGVGFNFFLNPNWLLNFNYDYQDWSTDNGTDKTFFSNGTTSKTQLNEVNWTSHTFSLGINYRF